MWLAPKRPDGRAASVKSVKPANLTYGVDELPPLFDTLVLAFQHVLVMSVGWIFVVVLVTTVSGTPQQSESVIRMSMIASGLATILQGRNKGLVGSGYLCPSSCGPSYLAASILAGKTGGLPLVFGLTAVSGIFEGLFSRVLRRSRALFPPEVTGLVVSVVGIELIALGCPRFLGYSRAGSTVDTRSTAVGLITLISMVAPTIWSKGKLRFYPVLLGLCAGYVSTISFGLMTISQFNQLLNVPIFSLPHRVSGGVTFSLALLGPFLIASLSSVLKSVGDLTLCQKVNDSHWKRTDMKSVSGGVLAGSFGTALAGLIGGVGQSTFSSNVGLSIATGATSRGVALPTGILIIALAFLPKLAVGFAGMPQPVMGAVLIYVACFMIVGGLQVITSRMLDARKTFVVGLSLVFGLSVEIVPELYRQVPTLIRPLFASALSLSTVLVILLNLLFRIGVARRRSLELVPGPHNLDTISRFMEEQGGAWGMRREVVSRATHALHELMTIIQSLQPTPSSVIVQAEFDEFLLKIDVDYDGEPLHLSDALPPTETLASESAIRLLSGYMIRQYADLVKVAGQSGHCHVGLHFEH
jgi:xanthine permease XanP